MRNHKAELSQYADEGYRALTLRLSPALAPERVLGVRVPRLREYAKALAAQGEAEAFLASLPHGTFEEDMLHSILLSRLPHTAEDAIARIDAFLPYVTSWNVCDTIRPRAFTRDLDAVYLAVLRWLGSGKTYTVRFGLVTLTYFFTDEHFVPDALSRVAELGSGDYYIDMAAAWYYSFALIHHYEETLPLLEGGSLSKFVHNKSIQKAVESFRVSDEHKAYLKTLRRQR